MRRSYLFQFLIGTITSSRMSLYNLLAEQVSIPYRYDNIETGRCLWCGPDGVSIPYRYDNIVKKKTVSKDTVVFQFLIGTITSRKNIRNT